MDKSGGASLRFMPSIKWTLEQVADFLGVSTAEARELVQEGFIHFVKILGPRAFDRSAVMGWRRGLIDGGRRGPAYVREILGTSVVAPTS